MLNVLSLAAVYPNPEEPNRGIFVRNRLRSLANLVELKVVAPVGVYDYVRSGRRWIGSRNIPPRSSSDGFDVLYPRWIYPPGGTSLNPLFEYVRLRPFLSRLRRKYPFDVIDAHFGYPEGIAAAKLAHDFGVPFVVTLRGSEILHAESATKRRQLSKMLKNAAKIIAVSESLRNFAITLGAGEASTVTIPNGIDSTIFHPRDRAEARAERGLAAGVRVVLSAGNLIALKGHHRIVRALASVRASGVDAELWIAGGPGYEPDYEAQLARTIADAGLAAHVRMLGVLSHDALARTISAADILCLASSREGWPNVVHEAMACGAPVVATAVGGVPQMIPSSDYGIVVPPGNDEALASAIASALARAWDQDAISSWGRSRSWDRVAEEVYEQLHSVTARTVA